MKIILISGKAEAGKTTAANYIKAVLESAYDQRVAIIPYGAYVKFTAKTVWGWDGKKDEAGRKLLQWWGTDVVRARKPNFWVDRVIEIAEQSKYYLDYLIVDDCRFPNEIEAWKDRRHLTKSPDGDLHFYPDWPEIYTLRIERPGHENALTPEQRKHPSETALDNYIFDMGVAAEDLQRLSFELCKTVIPKITENLEVRE